jgi:ubiquinone/menaquinone biosynthesis C-methylase UbiE
MVYISGGNELINPEEILNRAGVKSGMKIADLGCGGAGHFIIPAAHKVGSQGMAYAVDILKSVLRSVISRARLEGVNNVKLVWSNLEIPGATKIPDQSLDVALLINILFQSKQHENIIKEAQRLIQKQGKLVVIDWKPNAIATFGPPPIDRTKPDKIKQIAQKLGLKLIEEFDAGTYHFGLIFEK